MEKNMEDMFREIPIAEITLPLDWVGENFKGSRTNLQFSVARGDLRHLDRIDLACSNDFYGINFEQVKRYVLSLARRRAGARRSLARILVWVVPPILFCCVSFGFCCWV